jgi:hypothetical protein
VRIAAEAACRTAAAAAGKTFSSVLTSSYYPRGCCYYDTYVSFNTDAVGAGSTSYQLLCAAVTTGAPSTPLRARACVHRRVQRQCACAWTHVVVAEAPARSCGSLWRCCGGTSG